MENIFFIKNKEIAFQVDKNAKFHTKSHMAYSPSQVCTFDEWFIEYGFIVKTQMSKKELKDKGILVSSPNTNYNF